jgi:hypothetical protein
MTIEELRDRCVYWQKRLRLQDWDVRLSLVRQWEVPNDFGTCDPCVSKKIATLKILDRIDEGDPSDIEAYDAEKTLVHELLHMHFAAFAATDDTPEETAQHQVIHALSHALVTLERERFGPATVTPKPEPQVADMLVAIQGNGAR